MPPDSIIHIVRATAHGRESLCGCEEVMAVYPGELTEYPVETICQTCRRLLAAADGGEPGGSGPDIDGTRVSGGFRHDDGNSPEFRSFIGRVSPKEGEEQVPFPAHR